jgi:hypothetical protein
LLEVFGTGQQTDENEELVSTLYEEIGLLEVQLDWLKKNLKNSVSEMRTVIEKNERLSIKEQYKLLVELTTMRRKWNL